MWKEVDNSLKRSFEFRDFVQAFSFMTSVAMVAEKMDHHPTWSNTYNRVDISLSTHDAGDIVTEKDQALSKAIDEIYKTLASVIFFHLSFYFFQTLLDYRC